jgi:hypothetical protein
MRSVDFDPNPVDTSVGVTCEVDQPDLVVELDTRFLSRRLKHRVEDGATRRVQSPDTEV